MSELTHLSLFSGIGGLDLAAEWAGMKTVGQCEWAEYPTKVLEKHWPDVPRWKDIRTLTGESYYERTGRRTVDVISGGFPCQPFSVAGKQRGKEDDRYLWPEMVRVIKELRPTWIVGENVAGIVRMALPDILSELETCGYRTRTFLVPACAVGARHRRYRVAIVGYAEHNGSPSPAVAGRIGASSNREQKGTEAAGESSGAGKPRNSESMGRAEDLENPSSIRRRQPGNVCEQPGRTQSERSGQDMANTQSDRFQRLREEGEQVCGTRPEERESERGSVICNATGQRLPDRSGEQMGGQGTQEPEPQRPDSNVSDTNNRSRNVRRDRELSAAKKAGGTGHDFGSREKEHEPGERWAAESVLGGVVDGLPARLDRDYLINRYWDTEPDIPRTATGIKNRVDRLKCLGNAVVPQQFYPVFRAIAEIERKQG
ncbi:DNA cytosine methyltransferase [Cuneatibacter caecimuris]|uniref:Cytosine-specific methyltransferase n=1 Tax=Cuneatibacter caecimuris TaxID=1796618 RepID=A0A4Q7PLB0_9FIRM|nr:DNA (cytosine-5-)-methyltransferase [Cuneatibacter caecimuris]RZT00918.1 DNA-cytosine methyltransferase [Cuneatibacter caecimuris]